MKLLKSHRAFFVSSIVIVISFLGVTTQFSILNQRLLPNWASWKSQPVEKNHFLLWILLTSLVGMAFCVCFYVWRDLSKVPSTNRSRRKRGNLKSWSWNEIERQMFARRRKSGEKKAKQSTAGSAYKVRKGKRIKGANLQNNGNELPFDVRVDLIDDNNNMCNGDDEKETESHIFSEREESSNRNHSNGRMLVKHVDDSQPTGNTDGKNQLSDTPAPQNHGNLKPGWRQELQTAYTEEEVLGHQLGKLSFAQSMSSNVQTTAEHRTLDFLMPAEAETKADLVSRKAEHKSTLGTTSQAEIPLLKNIQSQKDVCTQTAQDDLRKTAATMTLPQATDSCVGTHSKPCKITRCSGTMTSGPFMKKLRRAERTLHRAVDAIKKERDSKTSEWREVIGKYREKLKFFAEKVSKKDEIMGFTSSSMVVLKHEVKDTFLAVRSTKERLSTQRKLNIALMDVVESKKGDESHQGNGEADPKKSGEEKEGKA